MLKTVLRTLLALALAVPAGAETFDIDASHSTVGFKIRHLVGKVSGRFDKFEGSFEYEEGKPASWKATAVIDAASINTANAKRDEHLRNPDFFDTAKCPKIEFKSTKVTGKAPKAKLHGDLTMHCVTKPVVLDLEIGEVMDDPWGSRRAGFTATGKLSRKDWGVTYNTKLDKGGFVLGEDVDVVLEIEGVKRKDAGEKNAKKG